ncbi:hypothetical protein [Halomonas sp. AOP42-B2-16]|uniref:hypothetical protein n=1 Tax=Halomonas sp. AOP42-B2-16 TaxID=3457673 RepID=UPI004034875A
MALYSTLWAALTASTRILVPLTVSSVVLEEGFSIIEQSLEALSKHTKGLYTARRCHIVKVVCDWRAILFLNSAFTLSACGILGGFRYHALSVSTE